MRKIANDELGRPTPEQYAGMEKMPVTVVLDGIRSLNNVGSFFRTCDAFAVERILLCGITATPPDREIHKTALGAENSVPWRHFPDVAEALRELKAAGTEIVAVEQVEGAVAPNEFDCRAGRSYALVFGNEVFGVSDEALALCDSAIEIPQAGTKHSVNVAVSGGIVLWRFFSALYTIE